MCVIIVREPGIEIDPDKLRSACQVNPHGYGVSVIDRGKIETIKNLNEKGNNPDELIKIFEDAKDQKIIAHLRYMTKGVKNLENCHPFPLYKEGDFEALFMHNGTIGQFGDNDRSDSRHFAEEILGPMTRAFYGIEGANVFNNKTYKEVMEKYRPGGSIFTVYDSEGNVLSLGSGYQHEGWWSSNQYSFDRNHRSNSSTNSSTSYYRGASAWEDGYGSNYPWKDGVKVNRELEQHTAWRLHDYYAFHKKQWGRWEGNRWNVNVILTNLDPRCEKVEVKTEEKGKLLCLPGIGNDTTPEKVATTSSTSETTANENNKKETSAIDSLKEDCAAIGAAIHAAKNANLEPFEHTTPDKRVTFAELADLISIEEVQMLDEEELYELCERWPLAATMLMMDLIYELWRKKLNDRITAISDAQENRADAAAFKAVNS